VKRISPFEAGRAGIFLILADFGLMGIAGAEGKLKIKMKNAKLRRPFGRSFD